MVKKGFFKEKTRAQKSLIIALITTTILSIVVVILSFVYTIEKRVFMIPGIVTTPIPFIIGYRYTFRFPKTKKLEEITEEKEVKAVNWKIKTIWISSIVVFSIVALGSWFMWILNCLLLGHC